MIAIIEGDVRGYREVKTSKGSLYEYRVEVKDRSGAPYTLNIVSLKNGIKNGFQPIKVNIRNRFRKDGTLVKGFKIWIVDDQKGGK